MVGVTRFELATSCSQSTRATNCATPRKGQIDNLFENTEKVKRFIRKISGFAADCKVSESQDKKLLLKERL